MTMIQNMMIGFTEIEDSSSIVLSDSAKDLMNICKLVDVNAIEFQNGYSLISDALDFLVNKNHPRTRQIRQMLHVGNAFIEIALKASKANLFFKDFDSSKYDIYGYIEQVMHNAEIAKYSLLSTLARCKKYIICVERTVDTLDFLPSTIKALHANGITLVSDLMKFSRTELLSMSKIGQATIDEIVVILAENDIHLKGDADQICSVCDNQFIGCQSEENAICLDCNERLNRLKRNKRIEIRIELRLSSFKDGSRGFILYGDVKNNSKSIQSLSYKEAYIVSNGRQHSPNSYLSGYRWSDSEDLFPNSVKTIGLIWYNNYLDYTALKENDELIIVLSSSSENKYLYSSSESKSFFFKFIYTRLENAEDEDANVSYGFMLYDIIAK